MSAGPRGQPPPWDLVAAAWEKYLNTPIEGGQGPESPESQALQATRIWRFLDLKKLLSLLHYGALFFSRLDALGDPHEGELGGLNKKEREAEANGGDMVLLQRRWDEEAIVRTQSSAVCCWHMAKAETNHMWGIYGRSGVAIESTIGDCCRAFRTHRLTLGAKVQYVNWDAHRAEPDHPFAAALFKRDAFEAEAEFRMITPMLTGDITGSMAIVGAGRSTCAWVEGGDGPPRIVDFRPLAHVMMPGQEMPTVGPGILVPVDLRQLIRSVRLAPGSPPNDLNVMKGLLKKYELGDVPVLQSELDRPPFR